MKLKKNFVAATMLAGATTVMSFMSARCRAGAGRARDVLRRAGRMVPRR